jgi:hypothetical protein
MGINRKRNNPLSGLDLMTNLAVRADLGRKNVIKEAREILAKISSNVGSMQLAKIYLTEILKEITDALESKEQDRIKKLESAARCLVLLEIQLLLAHVLLAIESSEGTAHSKDKECAEALIKLAEDLGKDDD